MGTYQIKHLNFTYPGRGKKALDDLNFEIADGEFLVICGKSGCGKSTLLRHLKPALTPHGVRSGEILFHNRSVDQLSLKEQTSEIGYVLQSPDHQIVTDKVWHELAFGLESLGYDRAAIRLRVAEMASFFGIQNWFYKNVTELSGGQKQLLNLASIMAMQPSVLILDEPTSQLDPIAASEFLETVKKINDELGTTIILTEHRLEEAIPMADRVILMDDGRVTHDASPRVLGKQLKEHAHPMFSAMPSAMQIYTRISGDTLNCPLTVKEGRAFLESSFSVKAADQMQTSVLCTTNAEDPVITLRDVWFRYEKQGSDVIKDLSLKVNRGSFHAVVGANGTGKSTMLSLICGILTPYRGKILLNGKKISSYTDKDLFYQNLAMLPQNPQSLFVKKTVLLDLEEILSGRDLSKEQKRQRILQVSELTRITELLDQHPYDLSGGEQQRAALAKVLLLEPKILILDEPTKGLDACFKQTLAEILQKLRQQGVTILMVSHDIEFCARYTDTCSMFFDGNLVTTADTKRFFCGNSFYTTAANRMARHLWNDVVTNKDVIERCTAHQDV